MTSQQLVAIVAAADALPAGAAFQLEYDEGEEYAQARDLLLCAGCSAGRCDSLGWPDQEGSYEGVYPGGGDPQARAAYPQDRAVVVSPKGFVDADDTVEITPTGRLAARDLDAAISEATRSLDRELMPQASRDLASAMGVQERYDVRGHMLRLVLGSGE